MRAVKAVVNRLGGELMSSQSSDEPRSEALEVVDQGLYPIRTVASVTGVNPVTLRAWERRYGLMRPQRTPKGHRLYTEADIDRIRHILELLDQGIPIGQTRRLLDTPGAAAAEQTATDPWQEYRRRAAQAVSQFDIGALEAAYNDALSLYPLELVTQRLVLPLLDDLRDRREAVPEGAGELAFFRSYIRHKLGARFHHLAGRSRGLKILVAGLPAEDSPVELLLFMLAALNQGYRVIPLGDATPLPDLGPAVGRAACRALVIHWGRAPVTGDIGAELRALVAVSPVPVLVAGAGARQSVDTVRGAGATPLAADASQAVSLIRPALAPQGS